MSIPPNPLIELAERVEALTKADRAIDCEIAVAVGFEGNAICGGLVKSAADFPDQLLAVAHWHMVPAYTASLDAAMTLVPDYLNMVGSTTLPMKWGVGTLSSDVNPSHKFCALCRENGIVGGEPDYDASAATPALALTAASLRARAASEAIPHGR